MALYKEIISWKNKEEVATYHKIRTIWISAIYPNQNTILTQYAVTITVDSYESQAMKNKAESAVLFSKSYSTTVNSVELAVGGIMGILYKALKEQDDFKGAQDA
jgi:hypothetical protein